MLVAVLWAAALSTPSRAAHAPEPVVGDVRFQQLVADTKATMLADPKAALAKARMAAHYSESVADRRQQHLMKATARWLEGEAELRLNDLGRANPLIKEALQAVEQEIPRSKLNAEILLSAGGIAVEQAEVAQALSDYQRAHDIFAAIGETRSRAKALIQIASLYAGANDHSSAIKYFQQAREVYHEDPGLSVAIINGQANALKEMGRYAQAEKSFGEALVMARGMNSPMLAVAVLCNIARLRLLTGKTMLARANLAEAMRLTDLREASVYRPMVLSLSAQLALQTGAATRATRLIEARFRGIDLGTTSLSDREAHRTAYDIYRTTGRNDLALQHLAALKRLDDEATKLARSAGAALMAARFDFANQELRIANLQRDEARRNVIYEQARVRVQRNMFVGAAGATAIVIAMLGFGLVTLRRSRNKVRAANSDLAITNQALGHALAAKTEFLATTSHEIRTPLNGILGMTQVMLTDVTLPPATRERLTVVQTAGGRMRALVDDILDVAKMETGNLTVERAPFALDMLLRDSTRMWEDQAEAKGIDFVYDLADCPGMIVGDAARLRQIVANLMSNALKFTRVGGVRLQVRHGAENRLQICVSDSGVGIAEDTRETIFESFRQADTSTTRQFGGTGLGLAICRNLARAMGGDVSVTSTLGEGSCFVLDLPLELAPAPAGVRPRPPADGPALLIVDRNPITRSLLRTLMTTAAPDVRVAATVEEACTLLQSGTVTRMLIDGTGWPDAALDPLLAAAADMPVTLLEAASTDRTFASNRHLQILAKPIAGAALVRAIYPPCEPALVCRAA